MKWSLCCLPAHCCQQPWTFLSLYLSATRASRLSLSANCHLPARLLSSLLAQYCAHATLLPNP